MYTIFKKQVKCLKHQQKHENLKQDKGKRTSYKTLNQKKYFKKSEPSL